MSKTQGYQINNAAVLREERNRILVAARELLVPEGSDRASEPYLFMAGEPVDLTVLKIVSSLMEQTGSDIVYFEFEPGNAVLRPRSITVFASREGVTHMVRRCDLWMHRRGGGCVLIPTASVGHLVFERDEMVHLAGKPCGSTAAGITRAKHAVRRRAAAAPSQECRRYIHCTLPAAG